jgi:hypothetical protein
MSEIILNIRFIICHRVSPDQGVGECIVENLWVIIEKHSLEPVNIFSVIDVANFSTFSSLWNLSGEYQYNLADCGWTPADLTALGDAVQRHNPWKRPLSIHPSGRTNWPPPHNRQSSSPFHGEAWLDHHWLQTGQSANQLFNIVARLAENRALDPAMPVFLSEAWYERATEIESAYLIRWQVWTAFLNGAAGYGYGAWGMWQFLDPDDPHGEPGKSTRDSTVPWHEAIHFPGSAQVGHARTLLESLDWWRLEPRPEALRLDGKPSWPPTAADLTPPHAAAIGNETWIVYVPRGNEKRQIELSTDSASSNTVRWFDPRRGEFAGPAVAWGAESRILPPRPAPADEDWLLLVKTTK